MYADGLYTVYQRERRVEPSTERLSHVPEYEALSKGTKLKCS